MSLEPVWVSLANLTQGPEPPYLSLGLTLIFQHHTEEVSLPALDTNGRKKNSHQCQDVFWVLFLKDEELD